MNNKSAESAENYWNGCVITLAQTNESIESFFLANHLNIKYCDQMAEDVKHYKETGELTFSPLSKLKEEREMKMEEQNYDTEGSDPNEKNLLVYGYELIDNPHIKPLVRIAFSGEYPFGSRGTPHGKYLSNKRNEVIKEVSNRYRRLPQGIVFDLLNLHYVWGDMMSALFLPFLFLQSIVAVGETKEALSTLGATFAGIPPIFESVKDAIQHIETEMLKTFSITCPKCISRIKGKRLTYYSCPECSSKFVINLDGKARIGEEHEYKSVLNWMDRIKY